MEGLTIGGLIALMGIPSAVTGFCFWLLQRRITQQQVKKDKEEEARRKEEEERERLREKQESARRSRWVKRRPRPCSGSLTLTATETCTRLWTTPKR